jgi:hypothetical protein
MPYEAKAGRWACDYRIQVSHMAQMQNMFDFPSAPKLNLQGRLDPAKATTPQELHGEPKAGARFGGALEVGGVALEGRR